ncbi:hypothetical protein [Deinococcus sp. UYEF24]
MPVEIRTIFTRVERAAQAAFKETVEELETFTLATFDDPTWAWPGSTRRHNGQVAGTTRDVVDSGDLKGSQTLDFQGPLNARLEWSADYAAAVFLGAVFKKRSSSMPARNVPVIAVRNFNFPERFAAHMRGRL